MLAASGYHNIITQSRLALDLTDQKAVQTFLKDQRPSHVIVAAGRVGGILANQNEPAQFIAENLQIATNLVTTAHQAGVKKLLYLGSSCIYPKQAVQPIHEESLLSGPLEETNQWYAIAKIAGIKLCQAFRQQYGCDYVAAMPTNLYGPGDHYDANRSHVIPALLHKFHEAKRLGLPEVVCWGSGTPRREFLFVDDLAHACLTILNRYSSDQIINIGYGSDISIHDLTTLIQEVVGYEGRIVWDRHKPDGTYRKLLDSTKIQSLGWRAVTPLRSGLQQAYADYLDRFSPETHPTIPDTAVALQTHASAN